jgi:hypothetical protein
MPPTQNPQDFKSSFLRLQRRRCSVVSPAICKVADRLLRAITLVILPLHSRRSHTCRHDNWLRL